MDSKNLTRKYSVRSNTELKEHLRENYIIKILIEKKMTGKLICIMIR